MALWLAANAERVTELKRRYRKANPEKVAASIRAYRKTHPRKRKNEVAIQRKYAESHKEEIAEGKRKWQIANRQKVADYKRKYVEVNRAKVNEYRRRYWKAKRDKARVEQASVAALCVRRPVSMPPQPHQITRRKTILHDLSLRHVLLLALVLCLCGPRLYASEPPSKVSAEELDGIRKSSEKGDAMAQFNLGYCYFYGQGMPKDQVTAVKWLRLAADQGNTAAQHVLGLCYSTGEGVAKDNVTAYMWLNLSAAAGDPSWSKSREAVSRQMTKEQIGEAQRLSREWKPKKKSVSR